MSISIIKPDYNNTEDSKFEEPNFSISSSTTDEVNSLMNLAEDIRNKCEYYINRIEDLQIRKNTSLMTIFTIEIIGIFITFVVKYPFFLSEQTKKLFLFLFLIIFIFTIFVLWSISMNTSIKINNLKRKLRYEEKVLIKIVDLLREIGGLIAQKEGWDEFKRITFKIRLSRYEIGGYKI